MILKKILLAIIVNSLLSLTTWAARDVSQLHLEPGDGNWSLGFGLRNATFPYVGDDVETDFVPLITYNGERFFIDGTRAGIHLFHNDRWLVGTYAAYRYGGFNEEDSSELDGLDRDDGIDGRFAVTRISDYGRFTVDLGSDISDKSEGWDAQLRWGQLFQKGRYRFRPWLGLTYENDDLAHYYYGVNPDEVEEGRPAYDVGSTLEWSYGIDLSYQLSRNHYVGLNLQYTELDDEKIDSPITDENGVFHSMVTYRYEFNDYQSDISKSSSLFKDLSVGEWYWRVAAGATTEVKFNELMRFSNIFEKESRNTGLASMFVGKKIADSFMYMPFDTYATAGYVRRFERGEQSDFNEYVLGFKIYYSKFPWSDTVKTRVGIAEGVSYSEKVQVVEKDNVEGKNVKVLLCLCPFGCEYW